MKKVLLLIALVAFAFTGCKKESTSSAPITLTVDGAAVSLPIASYGGAGGIGTISGSNGSATSLKSLAIIITGTVALNTTYDISSGSSPVSFGYTQNSISYLSTTGSIRFTSVNPYNATFNFVATNGGNSVTVTNGVVRNVN